jgi:hypothetical protein
MDCNSGRVQRRGKNVAAGAPGTFDGPVARAPYAAIGAGVLADLAYCVGTIVFSLGVNSWPAWRQPVPASNGRSANEQSRRTICIVSACPSMVEARGANR